MNSTRSSNNYRKIINFGQVNPKNPLEVCFGNTINNKFEGGVLGDVIGGQMSRNCQMLLSDYCGKNWDGYCEMASHNINPNYPNEVLSCAMNVPGCGDLCKKLTNGEQLIRNSAFKRFCRTPDCAQRCEPFDPTNPLSPQICYPVSVPCFGPGECQIVCDTGDISRLDSDPLFFKMLENPQTCLDILIGLFKSAQEKGQVGQLMQTNFGKFANMNPVYFQ